MVGSACRQSCVDLAATPNPCGRKRGEKGEGEEGREIETKEREKDIIV